MIMRRPYSRTATRRDQLAKGPPNAQVSAGQVKEQAELTTSEEFRRLSEMAVTAQEHTDLKLAEINMQLAQLRDQLDQVQKVLRDVE